jgi:hypothetical protein
MIVTAGVGVPAVSCAAVNATTVGGAMAFATQRLPAADAGPLVPGEVVPFELHPIASAPVRQMRSAGERVGVRELERSIVMLLVEIR